MRLPTKAFDNALENVRDIFGEAIVSGGNASPPGLHCVATRVSAWGPRQ